MAIQNGKNALSWQSLTLKNKNSKIIDNESGEIKENTLTALLGPSGAGKTSLLNVLAGRVPSALQLKGNVLFFDEERDIDTWPKEVAYVEQSFYAYMNQTVYETILFAAKLRSKDSGIQKSGDAEMQENDAKIQKDDNKTEKNEHEMLKDDSEAMLKHDDEMHESKIEKQEDNDNIHKNDDGNKASTEKKSKNKISHKFDKEDNCDEENTKNENKDAANIINDMCACCTLGLKCY
ncbi:hypothetical protein BDAP_002282 [Binucleata daphniae]